MPKPQSRRPIGRPPSRLTTPVIGWAERRRYKRFCAAPDAPPEPPPTPPPMRGTPESRTRTPQLSRARTRHNLAAPDWVLADDAALHRTSEFALLWQCGVCCAWTRDPVRHGYSRRCSVCRVAWPPRVFIAPALDVHHFRTHAALVHAFAAEVRARRYDAIAGGRLVLDKRANTTSVEAMFLLVAQARDLAQQPAFAGEPRSLVQVMHQGQRYVGLVTGPLVPIWPDVLADVHDVPPTVTSTFTPVSAAHSALKTVPGEADAEEERNRPDQRAGRAGEPATGAAQHSGSHTALSREADAVARIVAAGGVFRS